MRHLETRRLHNKGIHTHAVLVLAGQVVGVLCGRVHVRTVQDDRVLDTPTCAVCARRARDLEAFWREQGH